MTWKEPLRVRQYRFQRFPSYFLGIFFVLLMFVLISVGLMEATGPSKGASPDRINDLLFLSEWAAPMLLILGGIPLLLNCLEATYFVDERGIHIQRAGILRTVRWRTVTHLEIVSSPTLENVCLIRVTISSKQTMIDPIPLRTGPYAPRKFWTAPQLQEEFPFETGEVDGAAIMELYQKYGRKKGSFRDTIFGTFKRK